MKAPQMRLGQFVRMNDDSLRGKIGAFGMGSVDVASVEVVSRTGDTYFKLIGDPDNAAYEMGAAFPMQKGSLNYMFVKLESPFLDKPIHAAIF
jgi:hypothetical protein